MGYRSQVAFIIKFNSIQDRDALWMLYANSNDEAKQEIAKAVEHRYAKPFITYGHEDITWYEGYAFVDAVDSMLSDAAEMFNASWRFVRIGEDIDDTVETEGGDAAHDLWDYLNVVRYAKVNFPDLADNVSASSSTPETSTSTSTI